MNYARKGYRVIPLHGVTEVPGKGFTCTCRAAFDCTSKGKHPRDNEWQKKPPLTEAEILEAWPSTGFRAASNVGIATGAESGFWVFDIDPDKGGLESAKRLAQEYPGAWEPTTVVKTGSGGFHYYFQLPEGFDVTNAKHGLKPYPGIDVRGNGGQVVAPPSVTDKGAYVLARTSSDEVGPAPAWMLDLLTPKVSDTPMTTDAAALPAVDDLDPEEAKRLAAYADRVRQAEVARLDRMREAAVPEGQQYVGEPWNETTFKVACNLIELANASWNAYTLAEAGADVAGHAPTDSTFTQADVQTRWESALEKIGDRARAVPPKRDTRLEVLSWDMPNDLALPPDAPADPRAQAPEDEWPRRPKNDIGNAVRMVDHYGDRLRWMSDANTWAYYNQGRWELVQEPFVRGLVQRLFTDILPRTEALSYDDQPGSDAQGNPTPSDREQFLGWLAKQAMSARVAAALAETKGRHELSVKYDDFDKSLLLLNVANGVIDLETGAAHPHSADLLFTRRSEAVYDPTATCPRWEAFLERVMPDPEMRAYLQRVVGYSLSGSMAEQAFFIHHGAGANGKSVFLQVIRAVVGEYGQSVPRDTLLSKKNADHPTSVARMAGMRFLEVSETGPGKRLDEEMVKGLTGGEKQTARFMGKDFFDFTPTGKIHYVTNHLPRMSDANSIWRRLHLIKWGVTIPDEEQDTRLAEKIIEEELNGVLAWAVRGAQDWSKGRLRPPAAALHDVREYRKDTDSFGEFMLDRLVEDGGATTKASEIYNAYKGWAYDVGLQPMVQASVVEALRERGFEYVRHADGRKIKGLAVKAVAPAPLAWDQ